MEAEQEEKVCSEGVLGVALCHEMHTFQQRHMRNIWTGAANSVV